MLFIYFSLCIFAKFFMSFLKAQVTFRLNFALIFSVIRHNSSVLFLAQHYILWSEEPIKEQFFRVIFECSSQNSLNSSCHFWNDKSIPLHILHYSSLSWHTTPLQIFISYIHTIKVPLLTLLSALVKICQISRVFFQTASQFFFKICISLKCHER